MKQSILLLSFIALVLFSCNKTTLDTAPGSLAGTWKMILVKENNTNVFISKPSSIERDVIITFVPNSSTAGIFSGETPTNVFGPDDYTLGVGQTIAMPVMAMTKVAETSWGAHFVDNIRNAQLFNFEAEGRLNIRTTNKTLTFQKLQ